MIPLTRALGLTHIESFLEFGEDTVPFEELFRVLEEMGLLTEFLLLWNSFYAFETPCDNLEEYALDHILSHMMTLHES